MQHPVYVLGGGQTPFGELWDKSLTDLIDESVSRALESADIMPTDIDMIVVSNMVGGSLNDQGHLGALTAGMLSHHPPAIRVEAACASGGVAIHTACALLESGKAGTVLVVGAEKLTDAPTAEVTRAIMQAGNSEKDGYAGLTFPGIFGMVANRYLHDFGLSRDELSMVSAAHHAAAVNNPYAQFRKKMTIESISTSPLVADPLRMLDCSPISDGAAAVILSTTKESPVRIVASQIATDHVSLADRRQITSFTSTKMAMNRALEEADWTRDDIDLVELHDCFSIAALVHLEDMGFAEEGAGITLYKEESLPINPSGGLKACGHPVGATGVKQILDCMKQLIGNAPNQITHAKRALTHNIGGVGATSAIHFLELHA